MSTDLKVFLKQLMTIGKQTDVWFVSGGVQEGIVKYLGNPILLHPLIPYFTASVFHRMGPRKIRGAHTPHRHSLMEPRRAQRRACRGGGAAESGI